MLDLTAGDHGVTGVGRAYGSSVRSDRQVQLLGTLQGDNST